MAGGLPASNLAQWDGSTWSALGDGVGTVNGLTVHDAGDGSGPRLHVGSTAGVQRWDGASWTLLGNLTGTVNAIASFQGLLIAAGNFNQDPPHAVLGIGVWNLTHWEEFAGGMPPGSIRSLPSAVDGLYAAGDFQIAGGEPASGFARWDGMGVFEAAPIGLDGTAWATASVTAADGRPEVVVAGEFTTAGGFAVGRLASWVGCEPCAVSCPGDVNGDGMVDVSDLLTVLSAWCPCD